MRDLDKLLRYDWGHMTATLCVRLQAGFDHREVIHQRFIGDIPSPCEVPRRIDASR